MWATIAKLVGGPLIKRGFDWLMGRQEVKKQERALKAEWELAAMRRSSTFLRIIAFVTIWGPLYHAYYLAMTTIEIKQPEDVGRAIEATLSGFPQWWATAAVTILLAVWGLREKSVMDVEKAVAEKEKERTKLEAARTFQERKRDERLRPDV